MNRKDFLKQIGFGAGAMMATYCLGSLTSCGTNGVLPSGNVNFTIDLSDPAYTSLANVGGWIKKDNVVIAHVEQDVYVAVTQVCSHEGLKRIAYRSGSKDFYCDAHGAVFGTNGSGKNSAAKAGLIVYNLDMSGSLMHVYS